MRFRDGLYKVSFETGLSFFQLAGIDEVFKKGSGGVIWNLL